MASRRTSDPYGGNERSDIGWKPIYKYTLVNSSISFQENYFFHRQNGTYCTYKEGAFIRHDLISNFAAGDLLYGTEEERLKVRPLIQLKLDGSADFITADEIHRVSSFNEEGKPYFTNFHSSYDKFIHLYQSNLGKSNPKSYHPFYATEKMTKSGILLSKREAQIRRSCKALISFMTSVRNKNIHFIIDNILERHSFTDAERRHVKKYRLYSNSNFKAYSEGAEVPWPWTGT